MLIRFQVLVQKRILTTLLSLNPRSLFVLTCEVTRWTRWLAPPPPPHLHGLSTLKYVAHRSLAVTRARCSAAEVVVPEQSLRPWGLNILRTSKQAPRCLEEIPTRHVGLGHWHCCIVHNDRRAAAAHAAMGIGLRPWELRRFATLGSTCNRSDGRHRDVSYSELWKSS